mgnify:FL=1
MMWLGKRIQAGAPSWFHKVTGRKGSPRALDLAAKRVHCLPAGSVAGNATRLIARRLALVWKV